MYQFNVFLLKKKHDIFSQKKQQLVIGKYKIKSTFFT